MKTILSHRRHLDFCEVSENVVRVPLFSSMVQAGTAAWADEHIDTYFALDASLVKRSKGVFCVKVSGDSMINAGISPGDILIVDSLERNVENRIVIASIDGGTTVKRLVRHGNKVYLVPANPNYQSVEIKPEMNFRVLGVVTHVIRETA
ncbi:MAG: LexA family transcriptional regulator [Chloroherpetonaceae bacterium]|nr:LexA family transcriptional regulator [Chloroherpetonaceae bacterium]MDW8437206.1 LexA family transcriptional regulator [Chloroherpetonaceae bacterium]